MSFWGVSVKPNTTKSTTIPEDCGLTLYTVALREGDVAKFSIKINEDEFFIATLLKDVCPQHKLRLDIAPGSEIVFKCVSDKGGCVDITGALINIEPEDFDDEDDEDDEDDDVDIDDEEDDEEEDEEEKKKPAAKKQALKKEEPAQKKTKVEAEGKKFKCSGCDRVFNSEQGRDAHFAAKHKK